MPKEMTRLVTGYLTADDIITFQKTFSDQYLSKDTILLKQIELQKKLDFVLNEINYIKREFLWWKERSLKLNFSSIDIVDILEIIHGSKFNDVMYYPDWLEIRVRNLRTKKEWKRYIIDLRQRYEILLLNELPKLVKYLNTEYHVFIINEVISFLNFLKNQYKIYKQYTTQQPIITWGTNNTSRDAQIYMNQIDFLLELFRKLKEKPIDEEIPSMVLPPKKGGRVAVKRLKIQF